MNSRIGKRMSKKTLSESFISIDISKIKAENFFKSSKITEVYIADKACQSVIQILATTSSKRPYI